MIRLKDLLEVESTKSEPVMIKIVISDDKTGLKDEKKQKEILRVLERNLKVKQFGKMDYSVSDIMSDIKYYPLTDKIVGNFPKSIFIHPGKLKQMGQASLLNTDKCRFKDELKTISKSLEIQQKK